MPFERLTTADRRRLGVAGHGGDLRGVLMPSLPGHSAKAVCAATAELVSKLRLAGELPAEARAEFARDPLVLSKLVLDSVLEVATPAGFVSGASALIHLRRAPEYHGVGPVSRVTLEALRYAQALESSGVPQLSARLYFFNRVPATPRLARAFGSVVDSLGLNRAPLSRELETEWQNLPAPPDNPGWLFWRNRHAAKKRSPYKLYVNVRPECLPETLRIAVPVLSRVKARGFKVGKDLYGVLRPDKFIVYLESDAHLHETASLLAPALSGMDVQITPFTANWDAEGLLSWGMDPPSGERLSTWQGTSWRRWLTDRLASALLVARQNGPSEIAPWEFAIDRIRMEGVDTQTWAPVHVSWQRGGE
ncbi:MAG: hypothetical protein ACLPXM_01900 [Terriglobales bacterium]